MFPLMGTALPGQLFLLPTFAVVLLLPFGNWVEWQRSLRQRPAGLLQRGR